MSSATILVAGVGNIFLGDDGFGVAVARRLMQRAATPHVRVVDFGIRGLDLSYALLGPYRLVVLIDMHRAPEDHERVEIAVRRRRPAARHPHRKVPEHAGARIGLVDYREDSHSGVT